MISLSKILRDNGLLFAFGAGAFFITCVAAAPASILPALVNVKNSPAAYKSIDGTVWAGSIQKLSVNGSLIGDVEYRLSPWSLLTVSPRLHVSSQNGAV
ncbi:MAG: type II secretion system protein N, partial [Hyphococcus sp.]